jgi:serine protease Do
VGGTDAVELVPGLTAALGDLAERLRRVTVQVRVGARSTGAGVVWLRHGLIVTNAHVATGENLEVVLPDDRGVRARLLARDPGRDLAALELPSGDHEAAARTDARGLRAGELVVALGHPLGVAYAAALGLVHRPPTGGRGPAAWLQADIRLAPGNSGGPLADAAGRVVGVNAMIVGGLGFAVPTHVVESFLNRMGRAGSRVRAA